MSIDEFNPNEGERENTIHDGRSSGKVVFSELVPRIDLNDTDLINPLLRAPEINALEKLLPDLKIIYSPFGHELEDGTYLFTDLHQWIINYYARYIFFRDFTRYVKEARIILNTDNPNLREAIRYRDSAISTASLIAGGRYVDPESDKIIDQETNSPNKQVSTINGAHASKLPSSHVIYLFNRHGSGFNEIGIGRNKLPFIVDYFKRNIVRNPLNPTHKESLEVFKSVIDNLDIDGRPFQEVVEDLLGKLQRESKEDDIERAFQLVVNVLMIAAYSGVSIDKFSGARFIRGKPVGNVLVDTIDKLFSDTNFKKYLKNKSVYNSFVALFLEDFSRYDIVNSIYTGQGKFSCLASLIYSKVLANPLLSDEDLRILLITEHRRSKAVYWSGYSSGFEISEGNLNNIIHQEVDETRRRFRDYFNKRFIVIEELDSSTYKAYLVAIV